jgi:Uma2 family endonuclease
MAAIPLPREPEIEYPESDGKPMAESDIHREAMMHVIEGLQDHFLADPEVYVTGNLLLYYEKGNRSASLAPDVFVVRGISKERRKTYLLWREHEAPCFVLEVTSESTRDEDLDTKKGRYARLGVEDYFLFDPLGDYLQPRFQGLRLVRGAYKPIRPEADGSLISRTLGVAFTPQGATLRMTDVKTGRQLLSYAEWKERAEAAEARAARAEARTAEEIAARRAAEVSAAQESAARRAAEERAAEESAARRAAEERARALAEELERFRRGR